MIQAALDKQRAMLEAQGVKLQAPPPQSKPAGPDPREKELKAAAEKAAAERAAAEKMLAEAKAASERAAADRLAAQKAAAELAAAEKAAAERAATAKLAADKAAAERLAAEKAAADKETARRLAAERVAAEKAAAEKAAADKALAATLAAERAAAERLAAQKAAAEMNAAADRATAEKTAAEKERLQIASAAPVSIAASSGSGRLPQPGDTWTYRLTEPKRKEGPKQREYVATVAASSDGGILEQYSIDKGPSGEWVHLRGAYLAPLGVSIISPYLFAFGDLAVGASIGRVQIFEPGCMRGNIQCGVEGKVIGQETISVPAGRFETIKVKVEHLWMPLGAMGGGVRGGREMTIWYSTATKRAVKFSSRLNVGLYPPVESDFDLELVSYQLK